MTSQSYNATWDQLEIRLRTIKNPLWGKMPNLQKHKIENMSIFLASLITMRPWVFQPRPKVPKTKPLLVLAMM